MRFHKWIICALSLVGLAVQAAEQVPVEVALIGRFAKGPVGSPVKVTALQFASMYGTANPELWPAEMQARRFFAQEGTAIHIIRADPEGSLRDALNGRAEEMTGRHALPLVRDLGIVVCPELTAIPAAEIPATLPAWRDAMTARRAMLILDPPAAIPSHTAMKQWVTQNVPPSSKSMAIYYPYLISNINGTNRTYGASGTLAAVWLHNDSLPGEGISAPPAGASLPLVANDVSLALNDSARTELNLAGICPIFKSGATIIPFGARHLDQTDAENRYIPVQRTRDWISTNVERMGVKSANRTNDPALWADLRANAEAFLHDFYLAGGLVGTSPSQAYFVRCGLGDTMTQSDVNNHVVKLLVGVALLTAEEFQILNFTWDTRNPARPVVPPRLVMKEGYSSMQLFYHTSSGAGYKLTSSPSLAAGSWLEHTAPVVGDNTWRRSEFQPIFGRRFYRSEQIALP